MILKNNWLFYGILVACLPSILSANITTLQSWDPAPIFNAANLNMPPDTPFCNNLKKRILNDSTDKHRRWGINISPFVQKATRAQQGENIYFGDSPNNIASTAVDLPQPGSPGGQMSDYQGTPYLMGLFLGQDIDGNSIWGGPTAADTGNVTNITLANVTATNLKKNLRDAINVLNNNPDPITTTPPDYNNALLYNIGTNPNATPPYTMPSIFSQSVLKDDTIYFGAFSVPLAYQKAGFRWEFNFDISDDIGFLARGGFCNITQRTGPALGLSQYSLPNTPQPVTIGSNANISLYTGLNTVANATTGANVFPFQPAQYTFDEWLTNNINDLLDPTDGADYDILTFSKIGVEDIQLLGFVRHPFTLHPVNTDKYATVILTPYMIAGGTIPIAPVRDYSKLYALPFGNNSHGSIGGVVGLTVDFINSIEFCLEFGATGFLKKTIYELPVPNHQLQRVIYPYRQDVDYSPGFNGQFSAIFNAYKFTHNVSFSLKYTYVQHTQDTITLVTPSQYFFPNMLEEKSMWNSQMLIGALVFELQPSAYLSIAWQGALTQKNAYCSNMILASLNFLF